MNSVNRGFLKVLKLSRSVSLFLVCCSVNSACKKTKVQGENRSTLVALAEVWRVGYLSLRLEYSRWNQILQFMYIIVKYQLYIVFI